MESNNFVPTISTFVTTRSGHYIGKPSLREQTQDMCGALRRWTGDYGNLGKPWLEPDYMTNSAFKAITIFDKNNILGSELQQVFIELQKNP